MVKAKYICPELSCDSTGSRIGGFIGSACKGVEDISQDIRHIRRPPRKKNQRLRVPRRSQFPARVSQRAPCLVASLVKANPKKHSFCGSVRIQTEVSLRAACLFYAAEFRTFSVHQPFVRGFWGLEDQGLTFGWLLCPKGPIRWIWWPQNVLFFSSLRAMRGLWALGPPDLRGYNKGTNFFPSLF